jgi:SAM-dependent methyltransferase
VALDLGCGSGWLTAMLTQRPTVEKVIAWDASPHFLTDMLPATFSLVGGELSRVERVCGEFTPLLLDDESVDLIVMGSAFHHASRPDALLSDLVRVVKPAGRIVLLNEVPLSVSWMLASIATRVLAAVVNSATSKVTISRPGHVAAEHVLYDDVLGDRALTMAQYLRLFRRHGLDVRVTETGLPSFQPHFRRSRFLERGLTHFLMQRQDSPAPL